MKRLILHLPINFVLPSTLQLLRTKSVSHARMRRTAQLYGTAFAVGMLVATNASSAILRAAGLGLIAPGAGFLMWAGAGSATQGLAVMLALGSATLFLAALIAWFATGNVLAPPLIWFLSAVSAASAGFGMLDPSPRAIWDLAPSYVMLFVLAFAGLILLLASRAAKRPRPVIPAWSPPAIGADERDALPELGLEDWQRIRLILDRALQPIASFDGFEWRDQFQTGAVRYQLNFLSYALSSLQQACLPAMQAYLLEAQRRLLAKQSNPRVWRYWQLENLWGNLRRGADPVPRDNIMYTGFVAAQIALAQAASSGRLVTNDPALDLRTTDGRRFTYSQDDLILCLSRQYAAAPFGLLACEPNWIYPLCNTITATALRTYDSQHGTHHWESVASTFRDGLEREFTAADGSLIPFRSSLTGLPAPALGGAVMQAFPCYFLNALFPDLAAQHWARFRSSIASRSWRRAFWPVDVGNYGFSYASSLAASAAAAAEMGDSDIAVQLLASLDEACPAVLSAGVRHRPRASLWAHGLEIIARHGTANGLRTLTTTGLRPEAPFIADAPYPAIFVAAARSEGRSLRATLYPDETPGIFALGIGGLMPDRHYRLADRTSALWRADKTGHLRLSIPVSGRTELHLVPVV